MRCCTGELAAWEGATRSADASPMLSRQPTPGPLTPAAAATAARRCCKLAKPPRRWRTQRSASGSIRAGRRGTSEGPWRLRRLGG